MLKSLLDIRVIILGCLTLGLSPYTPKPHLWGKLKWIAGGANEMALIDWLDLCLHGFPWILLIIWSARKIRKR